MITLHKTEIAYFFETPPKFHKSRFQGSPCLIKGSRAPLAIFLYPHPGYFNNIDNKKTITD